MDYQQPRGYMWPQLQPPPPGSDPNQRPPLPGSDPYHRPPPPPPPPSVSHPWPYPAPQFQFQHQTQHSPSPPPTHWPPPHQPHPHYPGHHPNSYTSHHLPYPPHSHYPPPHQIPPRPSHVSHSCAQDSGTAIGSHLPYTTNNNEEDWEAKARAWAAAKTATNNQLPPSHFTPSGRNEDQNNFHEQHSQPVGSASNYQEYPFATGPPAEMSQGQLQLFQHPVESTYAADAQSPFSSRDRSLACDSASSTLEDKASTIPFVHQQEVPSSYSSLAVTGEIAEGIENINGTFSAPVSSHQRHHIQQQQFDNGRPGWLEHRPQVFSGRPDFVAELSNQPLNFAPHFSHIQDPHAGPGHVHSSGAPLSVIGHSLGMSANYGWPPAPAPGPVYGPVGPPIPPRYQGDPIVMPPPSGPSAPIFPAGPGFQPNVPMIGATFGVTSAVHPNPISFPGDAYAVSERPKKPPVPNWLREEIIKNKSSLASSNLDTPKVDSPPVGGDVNDAYYRMRDHADSKSIDSSRSVEDDNDDDDEVEMEAARTVAINQEIKRILTEVLLKVTDELFDEIASKVLREDDVSFEDCQDTAIPKHQSVPSILTAKASAKVLIETKNKGIAYEDAHEKSNSSSPGDVLGLASYASDEEVDESKNKANQPELSSGIHLENCTTLENGSSDEGKVERNAFAGLDAGGTGEITTVGAKKNQISRNTEDSVEADHSALGDDGRLSGDDIDESRLFTPAFKKSVDRKEYLGDDSELKSGLKRSDVSQATKDVIKNEEDFEIRKEVICNKRDDEHVGRDEKTEKVNYNDSSRVKGNDKGRTAEQVMNSSGSRRQTSYSGNEDRADNRSKKRSYREDKDDKRLDRSIDEKNEHGRHRNGSSSSRHEQCRSSVTGSRAREGKHNSKMSHDSSDESSGGYSRRKSYHSRRDKSQSPIRSRKRHVSPSAHSRHSKRQHSPYSSLEGKREKKSTSRSKSPPRRRRR